MRKHKVWHGKRIRRHGFFRFVKEIEEATIWQHDHQLHEFECVCGSWTVGRDANFTVKAVPGKQTTVKCEVCSRKFLQQELEDG